MSESPLLKKTADASTNTELKLLKNKHLPVLEKLVDSSRRLNRAANELIEQISPADRSVSLFIAGTGAVGGTLIELIAGLDTDYSLNIVGACNSTNFVWDEGGITAPNLEQRLFEGDTTNWDAILEQLTNFAPEQLIFVDATGSPEVARLYPQIMRAGIHIATPSKRANTFEQVFYEQLQELSETNRTAFHYEPTVGAGLPVLSTISGLLDTSDEIHEISAAASGTMTYLFDELEHGTPFSKAVRTAREKGYAEPDPRDDLSGEDVARKFLTLARTVGLKVERSELDVESLVPEQLISVDRETFLNELSQVDDYWKSRIEQAKENNETLRYVGKLTNHSISVGIQSVPIDSPLGRLHGTDNLFQISTKRYAASPIVIQGPGAGKEVTAAGVLADVLKIANKIIGSEH